MNSYEALKRMTKVLLVESETELLGLFASELERNGFAIFTAKNGKEAIAKFAAHTPEIVILDHDTPNLGGLDILRRILAIRPQTKVIMLTSKGADLEDAEQLGLELFLLKPISLHSFVTSVLALSVIKNRPQMRIVTR